MKYSFYSGNIIPVVWLLLFSLFFQECKHSHTKQFVLSDSLFFSTGDSLTNTYVPAGKKPSIYYGLYSPADVAVIFQRNNISYNPEILNPPDYASRYSSTSKTALNLGIYGADLSYIKLFSDPRLTTSYLQTIMDLSANLGIPAEYLTGASRRIEENIDNSDSLNVIVSETFQHIITFMSDQDREGSAYLMITGGWIEAMYIALEELLKTNDPEVIRKIIEQKYALDFLLSSLKNYYNEPSVAYYYRMLFVLEKYYKKIKITFSKNNFHIDHNTKTILFAENTLYYNDEDLEKIKNIIASIRDIIVEE